MAERWEKKARRREGGGARAKRQKRIFEEGKIGPRGGGEGGSPRKIGKEECGRRKDMEGREGKRQKRGGRR